MSSGLEVRLTRGAETDLKAIFNYLAERGGPETADAFLEEFSKRLASLESFPMRGPIPKELEAIGIGDFRQLNFGKYRAIYRIAGAQVFISVIADGRRDMQTLLEQRLLSS